MLWIGCVRYEKFQRDFMARTFALIAPVRPLLHRVSCINKIVPNALKQYDTHRNINLGSNGVDWVHSLRKIPRDFMSQTFELIAPIQHILHRLSCNNKMVPNSPKHYETHQNMSLGSDGVDRLLSLQKKSYATSWDEILL
jgi:hypothetical protein